MSDIKPTKEQLKKIAEFTLNHTEENLVNQINAMVDKLEDLLKLVKSISEDDQNISKKAGRILSHTQWTIANLNIDTIITNVSEYDMAKTRLDMIKQYEEDIMANLEVGKIYTNGKLSKEITKIEDSDIYYKTQSGNEKMCFKTTFLDWIYKGELKEKKNKEPIKIDKDLYDWITMWSLSRNETFNQTLNHLLREKMNSDTKDYTDKIDKLMKGEYL